MNSKHKKTPLSEISIFDTGKLDSNAAVIGGKYPFFTCSPQTLAINDFAFDQEAILLAGNNAEGNFNVKYYSGKFNAYQRTYVITGRNNRELNLKYLFYALKLSLKKFKEISQGTATKFLTKKILNSFQIYLPPISTQDYIAAILSALDDKIENNRKTSEKLEQIAQAVFKRWFVDFDFPDEQDRPYKSSGGKIVESELGMIPEGWKKAKLENHMSFIKGKKPKEFCDKNVECSKQYLTIDGLNGGTPIFANADKMVECCKDEVLMVMDGASSGAVYCGYDGIVASTLAKLDMKDARINEIIFQLLVYYQNDIRDHTTGSAIPHADKGFILNYPITIPNNQLLEQIADIFSQNRKSIIILKEENSLLQQTRDTLLPKLMSGEVEV